MARPKQAIINDLMGELDKFGGHITQIRDAIQSKGVTSEGKFSKFAEEIYQITTGSQYDIFASAIESAKYKGYSTNDIRDILINLPLKQQPQPEPSEGEEYTDTDVASLDYNYVSNRIPRNATIIKFPNVTSVDLMAFSGKQFKEIYLPKLVDIGGMAFGACSADILSIPSYVFKEENAGIERMNVLKELVVHGDSIIPSVLFDYLPDVVVYTPDKTKKWDKVSKQWKEV